MVVVTNEPPVFSFSKRIPPVVTVEPGSAIAFQTSDDVYANMTGSAIDSGLVDFSQANALAGPVFVRNAEPGDAVGISIERIEVNQRAFAVFVARWRSRMFGLHVSSVTDVEIENEAVHLPGGGVMRVRPMVGCCGVAPRTGSLPTLSPTARTGGNMDLIELGPGATIWLPVEVPGALLSLGDIHARMGRGEPFGSGLECGGTVFGVIRHAPGRAPAMPVVVTEHSICFIGTGRDASTAEAEAVQAAWSWLTGAAGMAQRDALPTCAGLLHLNLGGPAGANVVASFERDALIEAGARGDAWPLAP